LISRLPDFQGRVTCDAVLAKAGGGCFGIRRLSRMMRRQSPQSNEYRGDRFCREDMGRMTSMKRALMFLLLGPALVVTAWLIFIAAIEGLRSPVDLVATVLFIFTFVVAAITGLVDGCLARDLPIHLRTLLTASVGALIAWSLAYALFRGVFSPMSISWLLMPFAIGGAVVMGACSLLSHDYSGRQRHSIEPVSA
jgi:hypothetical protein